MAAAVRCFVLLDLPTATSGGSSFRYSALRQACFEIFRCLWHHLVFFGLFFCYSSSGSGCFFRVFILARSPGFGVFQFILVVMNGG